jgi:hypothetical protein
MRKIARILGIAQNLQQKWLCLRKIKEYMSSAVYVSVLIS